MNKTIFSVIVLVCFSLFFSVTRASIAQEEATDLPPAKQLVLDLLIASQQEPVLLNSLVYYWEFDGTDKMELGLVLDKTTRAQQLARYEELLKEQDEAIEYKTVIKQDAILVVDTKSIYDRASKQFKELLNDPGSHLEAIHLNYNYPDVQNIINEDGFDEARESLKVGIFNLHGRIRWTEQLNAIQPIINSITDGIIEGEVSPQHPFSLSPVPKFVVPTASQSLKEYWGLLEAKLKQHRSLHNLMYEIFPVRDHLGSELKYEIYAYYDSQSYELQKDAFNRLVKSIQSDIPVVVVRELSLPYSVICQRINLAIEGDPNLDGCLVRGVRFKSQGYQSVGYRGSKMSESQEAIDYNIAIHLTGDCMRKDQHELLNEIASKEFQLNDQWRTFLDDYTYESVIWFLAKSEDTMLIPHYTTADHKTSDQARALMEGHFSLRDGLRKLEHAAQQEACEMPELAKQSRLEATALLIEAEKGFVESMAIDPTKLEYRYLRVLCLLANNNREAAAVHMQQIVKRNETLPNYDESCEQLEHFQGPLRIELIELERKIRAATKYTHIGLPSR